MEALSPAAIQVFLVAPPMLLRWGLERLLETGDPSVELAGTAATLEEVHLRIDEVQADVFVVDVDDLRGGDALRALLASTSARLLALASQEVLQLDWVLMAGARGVVRKSDGPGSFLKAIRKVHQGELWIDRAAFSRLVGGAARSNLMMSASDPESERIARLTKRERQTILAMATNAAAPGKVIASSLSISEHTLRNHLTSIYDKLNLQNRLDLYAYATRHGLDRQPQ
jgi:DNA-binding NarL/FixJ family response regulator